MQNVRKIHSSQCASLPFGSQRRYFNKLYARLREVPVEQQVVDAPKPETAAIGDNDGYSLELQKYSFLHRAERGGTKTGGLIDYWQCQKCRMVPFGYRAPGSLYFERPEVETMKRHFETCKHDAIFWDGIQQSMTELDQKYGVGTRLIHRESFKNLLRCVFGHCDEVFNGFMVALGDTTKSPSHHGSYLWLKLPRTLKFGEVEAAFSGLAEELKLESRRLYDHSGMLQFLQQLSCNFQVPMPMPRGEEEGGVTIEKLPVS
jgi:hypothetical protein